MKYNYYCTGKNGEELRAIAINGHWRITKRNPDRISKMQWLFLDNTEYSTAIEAMEKYV